MKKTVVIIGAGPAGLATAYEFVKQQKTNDFRIILFEKETSVGGISKTLDYKGYKFDIGGHRFYTKFPEINAFYQEYLGKDMLVRKRLSRIYYGNKFYSYPLSAGEALRNLGIMRTGKIILSWLKRQIIPFPEEKNFDQWVSNRFGDELFKTFFKSYTEKVWGINTSQLSADWAAQRIENFNLFKALMNALFKINTDSKTIIKSFYYPKYGPGMLYNKMKEYLEKANVEIYLQQQAIGLKRKGNHISQVLIKDIKKNKIQIYPIDYLVSTMPFNQLVLACSPPSNLKKLIQKLKFRNLICVYLLTRQNPFPDQWIYIHDPKVYVGRIQNFRNWSPYMVKTGGSYTPIAMEYFTNANDSLWKKPDSELIDLAKTEIDSIHLLDKKNIMDAFVLRSENVYPIYDYDYQLPLKSSIEFINNFQNLYLCGRGGLFRYNNQDHSILTGFYTARNIIEGNRKYNVWKVNEKNDYLETK